MIGAASGPTLNREFSTDNVARLLKLKPFEVKSVLNALVKTIVSYNLVHIAANLLLTFLIL